MLSIVLEGLNVIFTDTYLRNVVLQQKDFLQM